MEAISLVLSAVTVAIEIHARIDAYRSSKKRIDRSLHRLQTQAVRFKEKGNELIYALKENEERIGEWLANDTGSVSSMNPTFPQQQPRLPTARALQDHVSNCEVLAKTIKEFLESLQRQLTRWTVQAAATGNKMREVVASLEDKSKRLVFVTLRKDESFLKSLDELKSLIDDFGHRTAMILDGIKSIRSTTSLMDNPRKRRAAADLNTIDRYQQIRSASTKLYETMAHGWICRKHPAHLVSVAFVEGNHQRDTIKFDVAVSVCESAATSVTSGSGQSASPESETVWLEIEHLEQVTPPTYNDSLPRVTFASAAMLSTFDDVINTHPTPSQTTATRALSGTSGGSTTSRPISTTSQAMQKVERDLAVTVNDFCDHFMGQYQSNPTRSECLGFLARQQKYLQKCYLSPQDRRYTGGVLPLDALISWVKQQATMGVLGAPLVNKLTKSLATSILHFHATPWLCDSWNSSNVKFFDRGGFLECELNPSPPHLQVALDMTNPAVPETATAGDTKLFLQFGKALLELGFSCPWESLQQSVSHESRSINDSDRTNPHYVAMQLCRRLKRRVGDRYVRVIENCIDADLKALYPSDDDQILFFAEVVGIMKDLDDRWQRFQQSLA
ncbi:hypothetical protein QBC38DRAFT_404690 [Podospora fimiseda]|uniref:DUF7580 domain-containing protein n=1 Tax=Podospora fimiseda TaxID=252190 RepID=A0AAN6YJV0_9PEZI|nr:hypothetical protein QBC38DRAFT_404690 [Podospora fimiseda]